MKKIKLLLILSIFTIALSSCNSNVVVTDKIETEKTTEIDNDFTVDYDSYMGKWYIFKSIEDTNSCGEMIFKDNNNKITISVNNFSGSENLTQLESLRFISEFTALGEGAFSQNSSTKYQFTFKTNDETKEDLCEINIVDKNTKEQLSKPLYLYRISSRSANSSAKNDVEPSKPAEESKPAPVVKTSKKEVFEKRAAAIEDYEVVAYENAYAQQEINIATYNVFEKWDALLNDVYKHLKSTLSSSEFNKLQKDELAWIKEKEAAIEEAAADWAGGSGEPMIRNSVATDYTKERCYYLISLVK